MRRLFLITTHDPSNGTEDFDAIEASSLAEALTIAERTDAGICTRVYGITPDDYDRARAEGIAFNDADGLLVQA